MNELQFKSLREIPERKDTAAQWLHEKWGVPKEAYRGRGIAGRLLNIAVEDLRAHGISPVYLVTDHTGFYERYGWEFYCMAQGDDEPEMTRCISTGKKRKM